MAFTQLTRFTFSVTAGLGLALGLASCVDGSLDSPGGTAGSLGAGASPGAGAGAGAGSNGTGAVAGTTGAGATGNGGANPTGAGGTTASGGTAGSVSAGGTAGSVSTGGTAGTGSGGGPPVCTDNQHPDHTDKPCSVWPEYDADPEANPMNCQAQWLTGSGYCLKSCGKCSDGSGGTGSGGSGNGGTGNGGGPQYPDITSGEEYHASRYWDCCKTHCATNAGAQSCGQNGTSNDSGGSSCNGGSAYACYSEAPRAISDTVSYGYVAVPNPSCNTCYHIQFTGQGYYSANDQGSQLIAGKHMIVKVSNTGSDVSQKQFDLMIPGGGVGQFTQGCQKQWGNIDFGAQYGGFYSGDSSDPQCNTGNHSQKKACVKAMCDQLPAGRAREGCYWWVDWMQLADNPKFRYTTIQCPNDI